MSETVKHTTERWEVFTTDNDPQLLNFHSAIYGPAGEYDGLFVALANQNGKYPEHANLIAAAPETVDYATLNNLGDPEKQHNVKWARQVIAKATTPKAGG